MIKQLFGNYLLNESFITKDQLVKAMRVKKSIKVRTDLMALNYNYLTLEQIVKINQQGAVDGDFLATALKLDFLTEEQVKKLEQEKPEYHLLFAQNLLDIGYLTEEKLLQVFSEYHLKYSLSDDDFTPDQNDNRKFILETFYNFKDKQTEHFFVTYTDLLFRNLVKFIGDDFIPLAATKIDLYCYDWVETQELKGKCRMLTGIDATPGPFTEFAKRYSGNPELNDRERIQDAVGDFLNLHNGLYAVNLSSTESIEITLEAQTSGNKGQILCIAQAFCLPICFPFGIINVLLIKED